jgi:adenosylhomocysteine nucleosidase
MTAEATKTQARKVPGPGKRRSALALFAAPLAFWAAPALAQGLLDEAPRIAVICAFAPELDALLARTDVERTVEDNGVRFSLGTLGGKPVVVFASGVSMVNAAMTTQLALDRFNVSTIVVDGIAGGVDPSLDVGDVTVPARWGQYLEAIFARETEGGFAPPPWADKPFPNFGMIFPQEIDVRRDGSAEPSSRFWFEADPKLLEVAAAVVDKVQLENCTAEGGCLATPPRIVVGGNGVSGQAFVDNAAFREYAFATFRAQVLDMETAAIGTVAYANGVPFIGFRSLSDLAGGGAGENEMTTFMGLAAGNAATLLVSFLEALPPETP